MKKAVRAEWLVTPDGRAFYRPFVIVEGGEVSEILEAPPENLAVEEYPGVLYPPFVNAHTHLELSNLFFNPDSFRDFFDWLFWIIGKRRTFTEQEIEEAVKRGIGELERFGVVYAGDISSFGISRKLLKNSRFKVFLEFIGKEVNPEELDPPLSVHSIYSVSFEAVKKIAEDARRRGYRFQVHLAETFEEVKFSRCEKNRFEEEVYPAIGRKRYERVCAEGAVDYLKKAGAVSENMIAVHCTNLNERELEQLLEAGVSIVLCPRSNLHLKAGFPKVENIIGYPKLALGTDGLSSNVDLSVVEELKLLYYSLEGKFSVKDLFYTITSGGAEVLGIKNYGKKAIFTGIRERGTADPFSLLLRDGLTFEIVDFSKAL